MANVNNSKLNLIGCKTTFKTIQYLDKHIAYKHARCEICDEVLADQKLLKLHEANAHYSVKTSEGNINI